MRLPICNDCAKTGVLCPGCADKLKKGEISEFEIQVFNAISSLESKFNLSEASVEKVIDLGTVAILLTKGNPGILIGKQGAVASEISSMIGKRARVIKILPDVKKTMQEIISPAILLGVNEVYKPEGKFFKIRIKAVRRLAIPEDSLANAFSSLLGGKVILSFE